MITIYYKSEMERLLQGQETYHILGNNPISEYKEELQKLVKKVWKKKEKKSAIFSSIGMQDPSDILSSQSTKKYWESVGETYSEQDLFHYLFHHSLIIL